MDETKIIERLVNRTPKILGEDSCQKYAIFLPLMKVNGETHILFEERAHHLRRQPGEICFPGGKVDHNDRSEKAAAIRETIEELQIDARFISDIFPLDYLASPYDRTIYYLFAGKVTIPFEQIYPNRDEVAEVFTVPLSYFFDEKPACYPVKLIPKPAENFPYHLIPGGENYKWRERSLDELFYIYQNRVIWGLTAKIVHHFIELLESSAENETIQ
ncbi:NUDIX hydrolase [Bacillus alveayuensis]|jgi:peroxisomal coenzyme A diphosphatase NUDT7|uniref:NUDIX hydrolase n=1 Tax=Aeribacillus alveayuensis TaxID=279215 RepID=UPI0005D1212F|nr:CoA pyrophosphatase [Bacillus alveayuensis]